LVVSAASIASADDGRDTLQRALSARFQPSQIEIQPGRRGGAVARTGRLLILALDGVPAKPFRVIRANPKSPWSHVMDFARVQIASDGRVTAEPAPLRLDRGSRLVVLDVKVDASHVRFLTHSADPVRVAGSAEPMYGCTEFVFELEPEVIRAGRVEPTVERIERWLEWTPEERVCAPGINQLCIEP